MKKNCLLFLVIVYSLSSCKKDVVEDAGFQQRCGTFFSQPYWAKNFKPDSLYNNLNIVNTRFSRRSPGNTFWDTSYANTLPIRFNSDGTGRINGIQSFQYRINLTESYPEIILSNVANLSSVYMFPNSFLNIGSIKMRVEDYSNKYFRLIFTNGIDYYSSTNAYEETWLLIAR